MPDGSLREFSLVESSVMEAGLAERYPEIKTYRGTNADYYMRMTISPYGFSYLCKNIFTGNIVATEKSQIQLMSISYSIVQIWI